LYGHAEHDRDGSGNRYAPADVKKPEGEASAWDEYIFRTVRFRANLRTMVAPYSDIFRLNPTTAA
jgi:hypothetical protein